MVPKETVKAMYADYTSGMSLAAVARKWDRHRKSIREVFERRGLELRPLPYVIKRLPDGRVEPAKPATLEEIETLIANAARLAVPAELKREWRQWSMKRRMWFIGKMRKRFPSTMPKGPFSKNVRPFNYGTPEARQIMERENKGLNSRTKRVQICPCCEGVIFEGKLWYWHFSHEERNRIDGDGYFEGRRKEHRGQASLHRLIWKRANKSDVPEGFTVIHKDGNKNNLSPENLTLRSRGDCAAQNSVWPRLKRDPMNPRLIAISDKIRAASIRSKKGISIKRTELLLKQQRESESTNGNINHKLVRRLVA